MAPQHPPRPAVRRRSPVNGFGEEATWLLVGYPQKGLI